MQAEFMLLEKKCNFPFPFVFVHDPGIMCVNSQTYCVILRRLGVVGVSSITLREITVIICILHTITWAYNQYYALLTLLKTFLIWVRRICTEMNILKKESNTSCTISDGLCVYNIILLHTNIAWSLL